MHHLASIPFASVRLHWDVPVRGSAPLRARQLRGALANAFSDDNLFHQHDGEGKPLYRYPHIQYRWNKGSGLVVGWGDAATILLNLPWLDLSLRLGDESVHVTDAIMQTNNGVFGISDRLLHYRLVSPALVFNQENYHKHQAMDKAGQEQERDRLLRAQLLTAMRGLNVVFTDRLYVAFASFRTQTCRYKEQDLLGLRGVFLSNALLPSGFAIGHAVSHGYGWIEPLDGEDQGI